MSESHRSPRLLPAIRKSLPLFWKALVTGEVKAAHQWILSAKAVCTSNGQMTSEMARQLKHRFPKFWRAFKCGQIRKAHRIYSLGMPMNRIDKKSILSKESLCEIRRYLPAHLRPVDRAVITQEIAVKFPLFWDALAAGEVLRAKEFVRQLKLKSTQLHRAHLSVELHSRFPKFWRALVAGEARGVDILIRKYCS